MQVLYVFDVESFGLFNYLCFYGTHWFYVYAYITPKMDINKSNRIVMLDSEDEVFIKVRILILGLV